MQPQTFTAILKRPEGVGTWTYCDIPFDVTLLYGVKGQVKVKGVLNGQTFRSSGMPHGDGTHYLVVNKALRDAAGVRQGDSVQVSIEPDQESRNLTLPLDLVKALGQNTPAKDAFDKLSYSHQKEYVGWIESAKKAETRQARIAKAMEMLLNGQTPKGRSP
jgi:hypothetical protein